ncbi:MAG: beta strand repeat-containing protein [Desulfamplus sp.]
MAIKGFDTNYFLTEAFNFGTTYPEYGAWVSTNKSLDELKANLLMTNRYEGETLRDKAESLYLAEGVEYKISPNQYFDAGEYKASWIQKYSEGRTITENQASEVFDNVVAESYNGDYYAHYLEEGALIGANPSNDFDESSYLQFMITELGIDQDAQWDHIDTVPELRAYAKANGFTALDFYTDFPELQADFPAIPVEGDERVTVIPDVPEEPDYDQNFTLTTAQDVWTGGSGDDVVRGVAGTPTGVQDQTTLNSSDILDGDGGNDALVVLLNANYGGGATVTNFETIQIGTNSGAVNFDYNVNAGFYEIVNTNVVVADQITTGETLNVLNITPSAAGNVGPALHWENEPGSIAGTVGLTYRQATIAGTSTNQDVILENITNGILNIGTGVEQITIESAGLVPQNVLFNSGNADTGVNAVAADIISSGALTNVVLTGATAIGRAAGVQAISGLTDRAVGVDGGLSAPAVPTTSELLSVGSRVTNVDASAMTAAANVRFTAKTDLSATNVSFVGGSGNDYAEFEFGNVTATGGEGDDTFSFLNARTNSTFGESDVLNGGVGTDTIQIGLNGAGTYNISQTELRNKTAIEVLDLRGAITNLTLSSDFVAASDTSDITIHTDRIIRTAVGTDADGTSTSGLENASTSTVNLTFLNGSQAVNYIGGSGSDRLILNDANFNVLQNLNGGVFDQLYAGRSAIAGAGRYDTLTVVTNGENVVLDSQDLSKVSNFNGIVLTKNSPAANYVIDLNNAFLNANTAAVDDPINTTLDDRAFVFGTAAAANNSALAAGDTIRFNLDGLSGTPAGRCFDLASLTAAGATIQFVQGGVTYTNTLAGTTGGVSAFFSGVAGATSATSADVAPGNTGRADVIASAAIPAPANIGKTLVAIGNGFDTTSGFMIQNSLMGTSFDDNLVINNVANFAGSTINLGGNATATPGDTITINPQVTAGLSFAALTSVETLVLAGGSTANVTGAAGMDIIANAASIFTLTGAGAVGTGSTGADIIFASAAGSTINGTAGNNTIFDDAGADIINGGTGNDTIFAGTGAVSDTINVSAGGNNTIIFAANVNGAAHNVTLGAGTDTIIINDSLLTNADAGFMTITGFNTAMDSFALASAGVDVSNGLFSDNATVLPPGALGQGSIVEINGVGALSYNYTNPNNVAALLTHLTNTMGATAVAGAEITVIAYNAAGDAALYMVGDDGTAGAFDAVELIGVLPNVGVNAFLSTNFS